MSTATTSRYPLFGNCGAELASQCDDTIALSTASSKLYCPHLVPVHTRSAPLRHETHRHPPLITTAHASRCGVCAQSFRLAVAYQNHPVCEVWDLRQPMTPNTKLEGFHTNGILGVEWCPHDQRILLTAGEDGRMGVWDPVNGHLLTEYATGGSGSTYDIVWSPHMKSVFGTTSFDHYGGVSVRSLPAAGSHVPSWIKRPSGGAFAFGGKFVTVTPAAVDPTPPAAGTQPPPPPASTQVMVTTLSLEPQLLALAEQFQQVLQSNDFMGFCEHKQQTATSDEERQTWTFMKILFEDEQKQRFLLLKELGFDPPQGSDPLAGGSGVKDKVAAVQQQTAVAGATSAMSASAELMTEDQFFGGDFNSGGDPLHPSEHEEKNANGTHPQTEEIKDNGRDAAVDANHTELDGVSAVRKSSAAAASSTPAKAYDPKNSYRSFAVDDEDESAIRHALIYGDFAAAVQRCLATGRVADAIVFSSFGPPQLWEETRNHYFATHPHPFIRNVMKSVSAAQLEDLVNNAPLLPSAASVSSWKETLAVLITYTTTDRYRSLVNQLADRLEAQGLLLPALLCYMCSSNVDKAVDLFSRQSAAVTADPTLQLHHAMEKIAVFAQATSAHLQPSSFPLLSLKYSEYATLLASQGFIVGAWNYLRVSDRSGTDPASGVLLDRLFHASYASDQPIQQQAPPFPFHLQQVGVDASLLAVDGVYEAAKRNRQALVQHTQMQQQQQQQQHQPQQSAPNQSAYGVPPQQQTQQQPYGQTQYGVPQQQPQQSAQRQQYAQPLQPQYAQQPPPQQQQQQYGTVQGGYPAQPPPQSQVHPPTPFPAPHYNPNSAGPASTPHFPGQPQTSQYGTQRPSFPPAPSQQPQQSQQPPMPHPGQHQHASSLPPQPGGYPPQQQQFGQAQQLPPPPSQQLPPPQQQQPHQSQFGGSHPQQPPQYPQPPPTGAPSAGSYSQPGQPPLPGQPQARPSPHGPVPAYPPQQQMPPPQAQQPQYPLAGQPQQQQQQQPMRPGMPPVQQSPSFAPQQQQMPSYSQQPQPAPTPYQPAGQQPFMSQPGMPPAQHGQLPPMPPTTQQQQLPPPQQQQMTQATPPQSTPSQPRIFTPAASQSAAPPAAAPPAQNSYQLSPGTPAPAPFAGGASAATTLASLQFLPEYQQMVNVLEQSVQQLTQRAAPAEQRKVNDLHQRLFSLYHKLSTPSVQAGQVSQSLSAELSALVQCVQVGDYVGSKRHHTNLVKSDWTGNNEWLLALKSLLELFKRYMWTGK